MHTVGAAKRQGHSGNLCTHTVGAVHNRIPYPQWEQCTHRDLCTQRSMHTGYPHTGWMLCAWWEQQSPRVTYQLFFFPFDSLLKFSTDLKSTPACFCSCGSPRSLAGLVDIKQEKPGEKRQSGKGLWIEIPRAICTVRQRLASRLSALLAPLIPAEPEGVGF